MVHAQPLHGRARGRLRGPRRHPGHAGHAAGRHPRPVGRAGHHLHQVPRPGAARGRGPGHLPADHGHAERALRQGGARLLLLRLFLRLRAVRGRHGHLLGALARAGIPQLRGRPPARRGDAEPRARRHRGGLGVPVRAAGHHRHLRPAGAAQHAGLVPALRAHIRAGRVRGGQHRRFREAVPGGGGPQPPAGLRPDHPAGQAGDPALERRRGRPAGGDGGDGVHGAQPRLHSLAGGPGAGGRGRRQHGHPGGAAQHRRRATGTRAAARHPGMERHGGGRGRHRGDALRRERPGGHPQRQGQAAFPAEAACPKGWRSSRATTAPT